jgi:hypothetical protein
MMKLTRLRVSKEEHYGFSKGERAPTRFLLLD